MMRPSTYPEWADGGSAIITVPISGLRQLGWTNGTQPPAQELNWWQNLVYQWTQYLDGHAGDAVTIGDGVTTFGDFNASSYATMDLLFAAVFAALPANGGRILIKAGTALSNFAGNAVALPAGKTVEIVGDHMDLPLTAPQITFAANEHFTCSSTGKLILRNLHIRTSSQAVNLTTAPCWLFDVLLETTATLDTNAILFGTNISDLLGRNVRFNSTAFTASIAANTGFGIRVSGTATRVDLQKVYYVPTAGVAGSAMSFSDVRSNFLLRDLILQSSQGGASIFLSSTDNVTNVLDRRIEHASLTGSCSIDLGSCGWLTVANMEDRTSGGFSAIAAYAGAGPIRFNDCSFYTTGGSQTLRGEYLDLRFERCLFEANITISDGGNGLGEVTFSKCRFVGGAAGNNLVTCLAIDVFNCEDCEFYNVGAAGNAGDDWCMAVVASGTAVNAVGVANFVNNRVRGFMNVTYTGVETTHTPRIFSVHADGAVVNCIGNKCTNLQNVSGGSQNYNVGYLLGCSSHDGATDSTVAWSEVRVQGNTVGQVGAGNADTAGLLNLSQVTPRTIDVSNNALTSMWISSSFPQYSDVIRVQFSASAGAPDLFRVHDNQFDFLSSDNTRLGFELIKLVSTGVYTIPSWSFKANQIVVRTTFTSIWDQSTRWGINVANTLTISQAVVFGNTCLNTEDAGTGLGSGAELETHFQGTVHRTLPTGGVPSAGTAWGSNEGIYGG